MVPERRQEEQKELLGDGQQKEERDGTYHQVGRMGHDEDIGIDIERLLDGCQVGGSSRVDTDEHTGDLAQPGDLVTEEIVTGKDDDQHRDECKKE